MAIHYFAASGTGQSRIERVRAKLFRELGDPVRKPRDFPAGCVAVHDIFLRCTDDRRLGFGHGGDGARAVAGGDGLLDLTYRSAHARTPRLVDGGAADGLT